MERSIIPIGFESTSHAVFRSFVAPLPLPQSLAKCLDVDEITSPGQTDAKRDIGRETCPICLDTVSDPCTIVLCKHHFCALCLLAWYRIRVVCPVCKQSGCYFLRGLHSGTKLWRVDNGNSIEKKPTQRLIAAAVLDHETLSTGECKVLSSQAHDTLRDLPRRKRGRNG